MRASAHAAGALVGAVAEWLVPPLDRARHALYAALAPILGPWIRQRDVRVLLHALSVAGGALGLTLLAPLPLLLVSPLLLGVPHLLADLRYLVARPGLHRRGGLAAAVGLGLVVCGVTADLRWGLLAAALAPLGSRGPLGRRLLAAAGLGALALTAFVAYAPSATALAHVHNLVAVGLWWLVAASLERGAVGLRIGGALVMLGGAAGLLLGAFDPWLAAAFARTLPGVPGLDAHALLMVPGLGDPWPMRLVAAFAYLQAVHYGLWLRVIPEDARRRPSPRTFRASWSALRRDLGEPVLAVGILAIGGLALWATLDLVAARDGYLRLALFHGPLELAILGLVVAEGPKVLRP